MELKYCAICGGIATSQAKEKSTPTPDRYVCGACQKTSKGKAVAEQGGRGSVRIKLPQPTGQTQDQPPKSPSRREIPLAGESLDLFSQNTIAMNQKKAQEVEDAIASKEGDPKLKDSLNLFSEQTILLKKKKHFGSGDSSPGLTAEEFSEDEALKFLSRDPDAGGAEGPARSAKRIQFNCLHCHSKLMVRPVQKTSKLVCPRCSKSMFLDPQGQISRDKPPGDSFRTGGSARLSAQAPAAPAAPGSAGEVSTRVSQIGTQELSEIVKQVQKREDMDLPPGDAGGLSIEGMLDVPAPDAAPMAPPPPASIPLEDPQLPVDNHLLKQFHLGDPVKGSITGGDAARGAAGPSLTSIPSLFKEPPPLADMPLPPPPSHHDLERSHKTHHADHGAGARSGSAVRSGRQPGVFARAALFSALLAGPLFLAAFALSPEKPAPRSAAPWVEKLELPARFIGEKVEAGLKKIEQLFPRK